MSYSYKGYVLNTYKDEPWYAREQSLFQDIINKIGSKGVDNVTEHRHSLIASPDGTPNPAFWSDSDGDLYVHNGYSAGVMSVNSAGLIQTGELDASDIPYTNDSYPSWSNVEDALNELTYTEIDITTLQNNADGSPGTTSIVEKGSTVSALTVNWVLNKTATAIELTDVVSGTILPGDTSYGFTGLSLTTDKTYTLNVTDSEGGTDSESTYIKFGLYSYWGQSSSGTPNEAQIEATLNGSSSLEEDTSSSISKSTFSQSGGGNYIYYAYPSSWGNASLLVNGFVSTWNKTTVSITNASGNTENYYCYTSPYTISGSITLAVS